LDGGSSYRINSSVGADRDLGVTPQSGRGGSDGI
jgi:hypothetical protein